MSAYVEKKLHNHLEECLPRHQTRGKFNLYLVTKKASKVILYWMERSKQRKELAGLEDHMLEDIGLSRADVRREISKPFWR